MSFTFAMHRTFLKHESGTKFYQTFLITRKDDDKPVEHACSITHHGPIRSIKLSDPRPITGGNSLVFPGAAKAEEQLAAKLRRGYYKDTSIPPLVFDNATAASEAFTRWFGAARRDQIMLHLGLTVNGEEVAAESDPSAAVEDTPIETKDPFTGRPAAWGSW